MGNFLVNLREVWQRAGLVPRVVLLASLLACAGAAALLVGWVRQPSLALLYSGLDPEDASRIVEKVRDAKVAYELRAGGTAVYVPEDQVYSLRLDLAGQGLPAGDQRGYRILDEEKIGTSPFTQRLNYRRALEGEIARSIQIIEGVAAARVHIVRPESTVFADSRPSASATVVLKLRGAARLTARNVAAIVRMVSGSVEGLRPEAVVVVDSAGNLLAGSTDDAFARGLGTILDFKTQHEEYLARKVEDMLTKVLGPNRASIRVDVTIDHSSMTTTSEVYDPAAKVVTKEEIKSKSAPGGSASSAEGAASAGPGKEETNVTDYLVGRTVKQEVLIPGKITAVSVAAMVDLTTPAEAPPAAEAGAEAAKPPAPPTIKVADLESLIRSALGLKETDSIKVVETAFHQARAAGAPAEDQGAGDTRTFYLDIAKHSSLGVLVVGALAALKVLSGPRKRAGAAGAQAMPAGAAAGALPPALGPEADSGLLRARISTALQENPEEVKRLFQTWAETEKGGA
ncbi:MAG: flagellar M-ring protein FliF [Planctomycetes bacterium]|nr:flagellar M-ring protein FliF [Planctomycetota bacterium]